jgi:hypothetical protein
MVCAILWGKILKANNYYIERHFTATTLIMFTPDSHLTTPSFPTVRELWRRDVWTRAFRKGVSQVLLGDLKG